MNAAISKLKLELSALRNLDSKKLILHFGVIFLGAAILSFGLYNIHSQSQITEGGVLGLTLLLQNWFDISPGISGPLFDCICYLIGFKILGAKFLWNAIAATASFSFCYNIYSQFDPLIPNLSDNPLFAAVLGGIFVGVGVGLVVKKGGASGGDDALALIISKYTKCNIAKAYFATDFVVLILSLSYIPVVKIFCSLITVSISSFLIGKIHQKS